MLNPVENDEVRGEPRKGPRLVYGFDPLCGWCYGFVPAMRALRERRPDLPITLALGGLVTGERVGPYHLMEGYIRGASQRLEAVTGRAPSQTFFDLITRPDTIGSSVEPSIVIQSVIDHEPEAALAFAHDVIEAHFTDGADLNDRTLYATLFERHGIDRPVPSLSENTAAIHRRFAETRSIGIDSFPTLLVVRDGRTLRLPTTYDGDELAELVDRARNVA